MKKIIFLLILFSLLNLQAYCQGSSPGTARESKSLAPYHRNVIKLNPTPMLLFSQIKNITFSYERLISDHQSLAFQAGYLAFENIMKDTVTGLIHFTGNQQQPGINLAFDYRHYLFHRNTRPVPDGVYIGGYASYYAFRFHNEFDVLHAEIDQDNEVSGTFNNVNIGFTLGYQFIFRKRLSLDLMVFGPSLQLTARKGEISGDLDEGQIDMIDEEIVDKLLDRFPLLGEVFSDDNLSFSGTRTSFGTGFRYSIQTGYHF